MYILYMNMNSSRQCVCEGQIDRADDHRLAS